MRGLFLFLFFFVFSAVAEAEDKGTLVLELSDGKIVSFQLERQPVITFAESEMIVNEGNGFSNKFPISNIVKYTFSNVSTNIVNVADVGDIKILQEGDNLNVSCLRQGQKLSLYSSDGTLVEQKVASVDGKMTISLHDVPSGVYIIKIATLTYKILKQ